MTTTSARSAAPNTVTESVHPLLTPHALPALTLPNRVVMAPMTRMRADRNAVPTPLMATYYAQRAGAGLIVSEGVSPSPAGQQYLTQPGLYSDRQVDAWRQVTDAVHAAGGRIFAQVMHAGRNAHPANRHDGGIPLAPSEVSRTHLVHTLDGKAAPVAPRAMTRTEVRAAVAEHADAAAEAIRAGFDGVEIHGANSYLPHQFLADNTNLRTDEYGGGTTGRIRFAVEVVEAVADAVGAERVGLRLSPGNTEGEMVERDPATVYRALLAAIDPLGLAYLHLTDDPVYPALADLRPRWSGTLVGNTGEHEETTQESAARLVGEGRADLVSVGRPFISTPDAVERLAAGIPWALIREREFHYTSGPRGYVDYPRSNGTPTLPAGASTSEKNKE
ncbi:alkene reductase [Nocardiopsis sp. NRRL B-16309]|uniref:alkene reductase n=1 Tax=Nocardiopsis sp. NRRL B-16309 TaxID=1519494 RepID=UPI0006AF19A7|nr:alkene reductase [Nocardiopsis sp. NRRL B-16309]KOX08822.1 1,2-oxophytodienoate reductase [Nocardiopsis sp. NRRL B-16309]